ncbi:metallophosphoesterase family protein [Ottowia sp. VDI28]
MLIAHVTDPHIGLDMSPMPGHPGTEVAFRRALAHVKQLSPAPKVLLLSGDLSDSGRAQDYATLLNILKEELPEQATQGPLVLAVPGNHDLPETARLVLGDLMPVAEDAPAGHACVHVEHGGLQFIGLDTVVPGKAYGVVSPPQLDWLEARLNACAGQPVVIFMHHPP